MNPIDDVKEAPVTASPESNELPSTPTSDQSRPGSTPPKAISPLTGLPKRAGGPDTHKPGCICRPCKARRRKAEAIAAGVGDADLPVSDSHSYASKDLLNANLPPIITKQRGARARVADWAMIRAAEPDLTDKEIAKRLGIAPATLKVLISNAARDGWLQFDDPMDKLEHELMPMAADNLKYHLGKKDKQVSLAIFSGAMVPKWKESQGIHEAAQTVLAIKIEPAPMQQLPGAPDIKIVAGTIVGKPKMLD